MYMYTSQNVLNNLKNWKKNPKIAGMKSSSIQPLILICIIIARLFLLPAIGFFIVKAAASLGFLPPDPLFQYVLVIQYALPPAMNISKWFHIYILLKLSRWHYNYTKCSVYLFLLLILHFNDIMQVPWLSCLM